MKKRITLRCCIILSLLSLLNNPLFSLNPKAKLVADLSFQISPGEEKTFFYKFADGDTIIFNAAVVKGNDISEVNISKWPANLVFSLYAIRVVENKVIVVEKKGVFLFSFKNSSLINSKIYKFTLHRIPAKEEFVDFDVSVKWDTLYDTTYISVIESTLVKIDTIPEEIVNVQQKIPAGERSYIEVSLPAKTSYWVYWIGVGQEAVNGLQQMVSQLPEKAAILGVTDPVTAFALGFLPQLFTLSRGLDIYYCFIKDYENLTKFLSGQDFFLFKEGGRVITDYAKMETPTKGNFYIGLSNSYSLLTPKIVTIKVVAVKTLPKYEIKTVQKPEVQIKIIPKME
jgi:hypothetical protein